VSAYPPIASDAQTSRNQEKDWPAVESAIRDLSKQRADRLAARASAPRAADPIERMSHRADAMTQTAAGLKKLADAARPLYQKLDEGQKHRFMVLVHFGGEWHHSGSRAGDH
jgi:zinc resistance-associated protein